MRLLNIAHMNIIEQERELKREIRQERSPRARKRLTKRLRAVQSVKVPAFTVIK